MSSGLEDLRKELSELHGRYMQLRKILKEMRRDQISLERKGPLPNETRVDIRECRRILRVIKKVISAWRSATIEKYCMQRNLQSNAFDAVITESFRTEYYFLLHHFCKVGTLRCFQLLPFVVSDGEFQIMSSCTTIGNAGAVVLIVLCLIVQSCSLPHFE